MAIMEILIRAQDQASDALKKTENKLESISKKVEAAGKKIAGMGKSLTKNVTVPLIGIGVASANTLAKFDDSMSQVAAIAGATGDELEKLRNLAKDLGATTAFSASEAADAMTYLALAGWDTNQILETTPHMLSLAGAGALDLATAADIVTDTMSAFQMEASSAEAVVDMFAKTSFSANTDVQLLGESMKYAGAAANAAGMDLAQTSAVLGVLADSGIKGSMAGTTLAAMLRDVQAAAEKGKISIGKTSIAVYDAEGKMRDLGSIMADVEKATEGMTDAQRNAELSSIFQQQAIRGVNIMLATGSERYKELEEAIRSSEGTASEAYAKMQDNLGGAFRDLKSKAEALLITFGEHLEPSIRKVADVLSSLASSFNDLEPQTQKNIVVIGALVAAVGPLLIVIGTAINLIGTAIKGFQALSTVVTLGMKAITLFGNVLTIATGPVGLIAAAIAALIAVGYLLVKNWDKIVEVGKNVWEGLKSIWEGIKETIAGVLNWIPEAASSSLKYAIGPFTLLYAGIKRVFDNIGQVWKSPINAIIRGFNFLINSLNSFKVKVPDWVPGFGGRTFGFNIRNIPTLHTGGVFNAPRPGGEGLAMLRDGEVVLPKLALTREENNQKPYVINVIVSGRKLAQVVGPHLRDEIFVHVG